MVGSRREKGAVSARTEGARRASGVGADGAAVGLGALAPGQRWSASRKRDVVLRLLRGESLDAVSREVGLEVYRLEAWKARALAGIELGLKAQAGEPLAAELDAAKRHIGELSMEIELLRERARASERRLPISDAEVATMSATTSATTGRRYGLERVCRTWERSRSALYARRARVRRPERGDGPGRRGPTPALSDAQLLAAIRSDLVRSPFQGEGHRKVHARLRILDDIRVSRTRVLRVMRAQGLLSPHRGRQGEMKAHDGTIVTSAPDVMWGTDGVRVFTADDGWVWTFAAVDHWNAECVGWHVARWGAVSRPSSRSRKDSGGSTARSRRTWPAGWRYGWTTAASICRTTSSTSPLLGHPPQLRLPRRAGNQRGRRALESHTQGASRLRPGLSKSRRRARGRRRVRRTLQPVLAPREAGVSHAKRSARGIRATPCRVA